MNSSHGFETPSKLVSIDVVIPVYNEGKNIETTLVSIAMHAKRNRFRATFAVLIVYDFEEDDTVGVVKSLIDNFKVLFGEGNGFSSIRLVKNASSGALQAIKTGIDASTADYVMVSMADGSDSYACFSDVLTAIEAGADVVCPSRYMAEGKRLGGSWLKGMLSRIAGVSLHWLTGIPTRDITNNFKAYRRTMLQGMRIKSKGGFEIGMELTTKAYLEGWEIVEVPTVWQERTKGKSRFKMREWLPCYLRWYFKLLFESKRPF